MYLQECKLCAFLIPPVGTEGTKDRLLSRMAHTAFLCETEPAHIPFITTGKSLQHWCTLKMQVFSVASVTVGLISPIFCHVKSWGLSKLQGKIMGSQRKMMCTSQMKHCMHLTKDATKYRLQRQRDIPPKFKWSSAQGWITMCLGIFLLNLAEGNKIIPIFCRQKQIPGWKPSCLTSHISSGITSPSPDSQVTL